VTVTLILIGYVSYVMVMVMVIVMVIERL